MIFFFIRSPVDGHFQSEGLTFDPVRTPDSFEGGRSFGSTLYSRVIGRGQSDSEGRSKYGRRQQPMPNAKCQMQHKLYGHV